MRVAAGAIARKVLSQQLGKKFVLRGALVQMGTHKIDRANWDWKEVGKNPFFAPDKKIVSVWEKYLLDIRKKGSSVGAVIEVVAAGVPAGLGAPIYGKLDADIASAMMSIPASMVFAMLGARVRLTEAPWCSVFHHCTE